MAHSDSDGAMAEKQLFEIEALLERRSYSQSGSERSTPKFPPPHNISYHADNNPKIPGSPSPSKHEKWDAYIPSKKSDIKEKKPAPHRTAYLDGLRGFAALLVYILHHQVWARIGVTQEHTLENAFGWEQHYTFATLPGIRVLFSGGHFAVAIFFIISGYVLVNKPLSLVHKGETSALSANLCSALFRRWLRLYLPVAVTTFCWAMSWHIFGIKSSLPGSIAPEKKFLDELWMWYCEFKNYSFMFNEKTENAYNGHAWSLPLEFRGSVVVWTVVLAFSQSTTLKRLVGELGLIWYFLYVVDGWYLALFMAGVLLCDLDLLILQDQVPYVLRRFLKPLPQWTYWLMFAASMWLGGVPSVSESVEVLRTQPGWYYLSFLKPQAVWDIRWYFRFWAALLMMIALPKLKLIKSFFETSFCTYLGRISFALYLVHGPILWSIGDRVYAATGRLQPHHIAVIPGWINAFRFPDVGPFGLEVNTLAAQLILLPLTLGVAEAVTILIDTPSMELVQSLFKWSKQGSTQHTQPDLLKRHG